jgi:hypothetical protein
VIERALWRVPIARLRAQRRRILAWLDDAVWMMPISVPSAEAWRVRWPAYVRSLGQIDGVICPSRRLASDIGKLTSTPTHFIPNYHDFPLIPEGAHDLGVAGWGGSYLHWTSWRDSGAFRQIPKHLRVEIIDHFLVAEMLRPYNQVVALPPMSIEAYLQRVASWGFYVIPLAGPYDARRSWIKFLEAAYVGTSPILFNPEEIQIYADCPQQLGIESQMRWAEEQRITRHLDEWRGVIYHG